MNNQEFLTLLKKEWAQRARKNPSYSLRAFARQLGMNSGALSQILNGKRGLTDKATLRLAERLNLPQEKIKDFLLRPQKAKSEVEPLYQSLKEDQMDLLSDWAHFAIIELTYLKEFKSSPEWIARRLQLPLAQTEDCVERLLRLKLLRRNNQGRLVDMSGGKNFYGDSAQTELLRRYLQKRWFIKATDAIDSVNPDRRSHSGITMSIDSRKLPEAIKKIKTFRRELSEYLGQGPRDHVYHLSIGLFPLTLEDKKKS